MSYRRAYWSMRGKLNIAAGLTWGGDERKRKLDADLEKIHGVKRKIIRNQQRAERFMAQGLTWRGTKRKRNAIAKMIETKWKQFRNQKPAQ